MSILEWCELFRKDSGDYSREKFDDFLKKYPELKANHVLAYVIRRSLYFELDRKEK